MKRCAYLTLEERGDFCIYDQLTFEPLRDLGWRVEEIPWSREGVDWSCFDLVVIRSTWDYQNDLPRFMSVLKSIAAQSRLLNPVSVCEWNAHKGYLADLQQAGVSIVPTVFATDPDTAMIERTYAQLGVEKLVVKPAIGANADDAYVLVKEDGEATARAVTALAGRDALIQPYLESVVEEGEYSLFYFGGEYSHAIRKQPAPGDFRVQEEHGGDIRPVVPEAAILEAGSRCLRELEDDLLYARIDLIRLSDGTMAVMEVELIEPSLYFDQDPGAAARFAKVFDEVASRA